MRLPPVAPVALHFVEALTLVGRQDGGDLAVGFVHFAMDPRVEIAAVAQDVLAVSIQDALDLRFLGGGQVEVPVQPPGQLARYKLGAAARQYAAVMNQV